MGTARHPGTLWLRQFPKALGLTPDGHLVLSPGASKRYAPDDPLVGGTACDVVRGYARDAPLTDRNLKWKKRAAKFCARQS